MTMAAATRLGRYEPCGALILDTNEPFWVSRGIRKSARIPSNLIVVLILADGLESVGCAL